jgi:tetratricopeptide (TPR) repeat protein
MIVCLVFWCVSIQAQVSAKPAASSPIERGIDLAGKLRCDEALPILNEFTPRETEKSVRYRALMATERCSTRKGDGKATVTALMALRHEYPRDPEVLYLTTQVFLEIAVRASRELADIAPDSHQVRQLEAETLESQNKWEDAAAIYRKILEQDPKLPTIHFRLGRALLSQPETPATIEDARTEFEKELAVDSTNGSAEFWLGELARRKGQWEDAIPHFTSAMKLDPMLTEAILALGMTLNSAERYAEAITPLERYTKIAPSDTAGHYQLALAYGRVGRNEDSLREKTIVRELSEKTPASASSADTPVHH